MAVPSFGCGTYPPPRVTIESPTAWPNPPSGHGGDHGPHHGAQLVARGRRHQALPHEEVHERDVPAQGRDGRVVVPSEERPRR